MSGEQMSTGEVAELLEVSTKTLQSWERQGMVSPQSTGEGKAKRLAWSSADIEAARGIAAANGQSISRLGQSIIEDLGPDFVRAYLRARMTAEHANQGEVVVVGPVGFRIFRSDTPLSHVVAAVRGIAIIIPHE